MARRSICMSVTLGTQGAGFGLSRIGQNLHGGYIYKGHGKFEKENEN